MARIKNVYKIDCKSDKAAEGGNEKKPNISLCDLEPKKIYEHESLAAIRRRLKEIPVVAKNIDLSILQKQQTLQNVDRRILFLGKYLKSELKRKATVTKFQEIFGEDFEDWEKFKKLMKLIKMVSLNQKVDGRKLCSRIKELLPQKRNDNGNKWKSENSYTLVEKLPNLEQQLLIKADNCKYSTLEPLEEERSEEYVEIVEALEVTDEEDDILPMDC